MAADAETWMRVLRNADAAGDTAAAQRAAQRVRELRAAPSNGLRADGAPLLPGEDGFDNTPTKQPSMLNRAGNYVTDYISHLKNAGNAAQQSASPAHAMRGSAEAMLAMGSGAVAPLLGAVETAVAGTPQEESIGRYQYEPRTPEGKAALQSIGALAKPITDLAEATGADAALLPLFATVPVPDAPAIVPRNGRSPATRGRPISGPSGPVAEADAAGQAVQGSSAALGRRSGLARVSEEPPTLESLRADAASAYKRADEAGIVVRPDSLQSLKARVASIAKKEGLDRDLHPDSAAAFKKIIQSKGDLTLSDLETLRKVANDARGSLKPADQRMAGQFVDELDDYIDNLGDADLVTGDATKAKALKEARALYSRAKKSEEISQLIERAKLSAPNFSASGMENALRTEFRNLAKNAKKMRRFTVEEQEAIRKVAMGGRMENTMRFIGRFAPTGPVSGTLVGGLGTIIAGPAGAAAPLVGLAGRELATRMTSRNAANAERLMRRGPVTAKAMEQQALVEALKSRGTQ